MDDKKPKFQIGQTVYYTEGNKLICAVIQGVCAVYNYEDPEGTDSKLKFFTFRYYFDKSIRPKEYSWISEERLSVTRFAI